MITKPSYFFANWKMYLNRTESRALAVELKKVATTWPNAFSVAVFPSALAFTEVASALQETSIALGAQNTHWLDKGGHTGEVSAQMYQEAGARYALVGHSERRHLAGETNHVVRQKMDAVIEAGLIPVLCVGETQAEHAAGQALEVVEVQLRSALADLLCPAEQMILIAYEPVWAVGTGIPCDPVDVAQMHERIISFAKALLPARTIAVVYGGSVRPENVALFLAQPGVSGVLVGAASVKIDSCSAIIQAMASYS